MKQNIFVTILELLKVKHTKIFSNRYFNEHPHKYNLLGLSKMLSEYGITNAAAKIKDKEKNLTEIQLPFITPMGGDFAVVHKIESDHVYLLWRSGQRMVSVANFLEAWNGVALLVEASDSSIEPNYQEHRKTEVLQFLIKALLCTAGGFVLLASYLKGRFYTNFGISLLLLFNLMGVFISWLLVKKHAHIQSRYADKICSLFKQSNCNSVLESGAAKLFGIIGWSEVGLGYFCTNTVILLFAPALTAYTALINMATLPFAFWSIWYLYTKAKQWCPLCLTVHFLLWSLFAVNCIWGYIRIPGLDFESLLTFAMLCCGYTAAILGLTLIAPKINSDKIVQNLRQSLNSIKADEEIFVALLKKQLRYDTDCHSVIRFGNPSGPLQLTVLSNPYCNPCALMHKRIEQLLQKTNNRIGIQYMLASFKEEWNITNKYLIAACLANNGGSVMQVITDWFENGKPLRDDYFKDWGLDPENAEVEAEFQKHEDWRKKSQISGTPTVLVHGYKLPENYKIEDLQNFIDIIV